MAVYDRGDQVRVTATFANSAGTATDPTAVTAQYIDPAGTITSKIYGTDAEVVKSATGVYYIDITLSSSGEWAARFSGTGTITAAGVTKIEAAKDRFA